MSGHEVENGSALSSLNTKGVRLAGGDFAELHYLSVDCDRPCS